MVWKNIYFRILNLIKINIFGKSKIIAVTTVIYIHKQTPKILLKPPNLTKPHQTPPNPTKPHQTPPNTTRKHQASLKHYSNKHEPVGLARLRRAVEAGSSSTRTCSAPTCPSPPCRRSNPLKHTNLLLPFMNAESSLEPRNMEFNNASHSRSLISIQIPASFHQENQYDSLICDRSIQSSKWKRNG